MRKQGAEGIETTSRGNPDWFSRFSSGRIGRVLHRLAPMLNADELITGELLQGPIGQSFDPFQEGAAIASYGNTVITITNLGAGGFTALLTAIENTTGQSPFGNSAMFQLLGLDIESTTAVGHTLILSMRDFQSGLMHRRRTLTIAGSTRHPWANLLGANGVGNETIFVPPGCTLGLENPNNVAAIDFINVRYQWVQTPVGFGFLRP